MKKILIWLVVVAILVFCFAVYRSRSRNHLDVTPDARREIEKAKQR
jgi:heme/copper-type cytochrome/quinol oxidase subunit 2